MASIHPNPVTASANEICHGQFLIIASHTPGHLATFTNTNSPVNCGTGSPPTGLHGNALYQVGAPVTTNPDVYAYVAQSAATNDDYRMVTCRTMSIFGIWRRGCVTHLDPNVGVAWQQNGEALWILTAGIGTVPSTLGADLNLEPNPPATIFPSSGWLSNWRDVSSHTMYSHSSSAPDRKIDYLLGSMYGHYAAGWPSRLCDASLSDHCMIRGTFFS